jgi:hypothetical protein
MGFLMPKMPKIPPPKDPIAPPTVDEAQANVDRQNRYRKRKGRKDYIFAGKDNQGGNAASNIGTNKLTGG